MDNNTYNTNFELPPGLFDTPALFHPADFGSGGSGGSAEGSPQYSGGRVLSNGRKRSPEAYLGLDAPTQPRRYITPSATSRKDVPAFFAKMKNRANPSDEEEDELTEEPPAANATDQEKIEWKRRQNTLAARRSRRRKLLHQQQLEQAVEQLTMEREIWRTRALTLKQLLRSHGIPCPEFDD